MNMVVKQAVEEASCWLEANKSTYMGLCLETMKEKQWEPLQADLIKCNVGIAWSRKDKTVGTAWITCDHMGKVLMHSR